MTALYIGLGGAIAVIGFIFGTMLKKSPKSKELKQDTQPNRTVQDTLKEELEYTPLEKVFIKFILTEAAEEHIRLAKKNNDIYICFSNSDIATFTAKWYGVVKSYKNGDIDERMYKSCINVYFED